MQRNVPIRLIWMMRSKASTGKMPDRAGLLVAARGLHGVAGAGAIDQDTLLAVCRARLGETGVDLRVRGDVDLAEHAAQLGRDRLALLR